MTNIDEEFLMSMYDKDLQKKIIGVVLENISDEEKIKKLAIHIREMNK